MFKTKLRRAQGLEAQHEEDGLILVDIDYVISSQADSGNCERALGIVNSISASIRFRLIVFIDKKIRQQKVAAQAQIAPKQDKSP